MPRLINSLEITEHDPHQVQAQESHLLAPELQVMFLTWFSFACVLFLLTKFAWKPILNALDQRELNLRKAIEEAEKTREEYLKIGDKRKQILMEADNAAKEIMQQTRSAAQKAAKLIEDRAKSEAEIVMENAQREIDADKEKASVYLREKSADIAVGLAGKILQENLDLEKHKKIVDALIDEL